MERKEIKKINGVLKQIEELEFIYREINGDGINHWWKVQTPQKEIFISNNETRLRFKEFIELEIETLKKEISLED